MSASWESNEPDETEYSLRLPFLDQTPPFTHGFEVGWQYGRMRYSVEGEYQQTVHTENQRQLLMAANAVGWSLRFEPLDETFSEMFATRQDAA